MIPDGHEFRERLRTSRLMLIFTPALCGERDPLEVLEELGPDVDVVQVRPKPLPGEEGSSAPGAPAEARATFDWDYAHLE